MANLARRKARRNIRNRKAGPSPAKAKRILSEGQIRGKPLTEAQRGFFGLVVGGKKPTRTS